MRSDLASRDILIGARDRKISELNSRLVGRDKIIADAGEEIEKLRSELTAANGEIKNLENQLDDLFGEPTAQDAEIENLKTEIERLKSELADRTQTPTEKSAAAGKDLPEAADLLNQLKARRKKSRADLGDINAILGLMAEDDASNPV